MSNPFGNPGAYDESDNYGNSSAAPAPAQSQSVNVDVNKYVSQEQQKDIAIAAGSAVASNAASQGRQQVSAVKADYNQAASTQADVNAAPDPPQCFTKCMAWLPLRLFAMFGGILLITMTILDLVFYSSRTLTFVYVIISVYLVLFGLITTCIEAPTFPLTRPFQLRIFYWLRFLSRTWGRGWFYIFVVFLTMGTISEGFTLIFLVGIYLSVIGIVSIVYAKSAANIYKRMFIFMAAGTEGDDLTHRISETFDQLDEDGDGRLVAKDFHTFATKANRVMSNAQRHAIQTFLDESCNGYVTKEDWMKQWTNYNLKQNFL